MNDVSSDNVRVHRFASVIPSHIESFIFDKRGAFIIAISVLGCDWSLKAGFPKGM